MQRTIEEVTREALKRITPSEEERLKIETLAAKLERKVTEASQQLSVESIVRIEGSVAKDTWLSDEPDIDIFMRVSPTIPRDSLGKTCLAVARKATEGSQQIERFADHPYLEAIVEQTRVNIVPCYNVERGEWQSATDRTPFHTDYVNKHSNTSLKKQIRLLKKFMKGIGVYGAEIKIGGFSGYLCELLILHFKGFIETLKTFASYRQRIVIDIEDHYRDRSGDIELLFEEPLVVIDPVDRARNVASAVRKQKFYSFIAAAREFLKTPDTMFFFPTKNAPLSQSEIKQRLTDRGSTIIAVTFKGFQTVPDVLWGHLYKSQRSLRRLLTTNDFVILRDEAWSDEKTVNMFIFEIEEPRLPKIKKHLGPPIEKERECVSFLQKHSGADSTVTGPYLEEGRWVVLNKRKNTSATVLLREKLKDGGKTAGIAEALSRKLAGGFEIIVNEELLDLYAENAGFAMFLTDFVVGRPGWLVSV